MTQFRRRMIGGALLAATMPACRSAAPAGASTAPQITPQSSAAAESDLRAAAKARADSARYPYTAADVHFMSGMISHHAQAIKMARWAPSHGASPSVRTLCDRIINAQQDEIGLMQRWLHDRRQPVPEASATGMKMMMGGMEHEMLMPGMLTEPQLKQLEEARGTTFDELFLKFMIQHHQGAVAMVKELFDSSGGQDETAFKFASDVNVDQSTEIARMEKMLARAMFGINVP